MEKFLPVILYGMDLAKYYIGNKFFFEGRMRRPWIAIAGGASLLFMLSAFSFTKSGANVFAYVLAAVVAGIMMEGKIGTKIIRMVWLFCMISFSDSAIYIPFENIMMNKDITRIIASSIVLVMIATGGYVSYKIETRFHNKKIIFNIVYTLLILICLCIGFAISAIQFMYEAIPKELKRIDLEYVIIISLIALVLLIILISYIQKLYNLLERATQTERNLKQIQATYYQSLLEKEEETRRYRHDMHNHLLYIREMAKEEGAEKTKQYADRLEEDWGSIGSNRYETGNMVLNILLHHYLEKLEGIKISVRGVCKRKLQIDEVDLCTIFSNLIQNAVEELRCRKEGSFTLKIEQGQENTRIMVCNSTDLILAKNNQELITSKEDRKNHGIGLKNVKQTVEKYNGDISWDADGKEFRVIVTMKI